VILISASLAMSRYSTTRSAGLLSQFGLNPHERAIPARGHEEVDLSKYAHGRDVEQGFVIRRGHEATTDRWLPVRKDSL
jgi:hypothetical protein